MKHVLISPVPKPKSFDGDVKFTQAEYTAAAKLGDVLVPFNTAMEAVQNSKGLYRLKTPAAEVAKTPQLPEPEDMTPDQIFAELTRYGKQPQKQMKRADAFKLIRDGREKSLGFLIMDDDEDE